MDADDMHLGDLTQIAKSTKETMKPIGDVVSLMHVEDKKLTLLGHGSTKKNSLGGMQPSALAKKLKSLVIKHSGIEEIELLGCHIGETTEEMPLSYATQLEIELQDQVGKHYDVKTLPSVANGNGGYKLFRSAGTTGKFAVVDFGSRKTYDSYKEIRKGLGAATAWEWVVHNKIAFTEYTPEEIRGNLVASRQTEEESGWRYKPVSQQGYGSNSPFYKEKKKEDCVVTCACVDALGLPDDCGELETLRWYRDTILAATAAGRREIQEYYSVAPALVERIRLEPDAPVCFEAIYNSLVIPTVDLIRAEDFSGAQTYYKAEVLRLQRMFLV